MLNSEIYGRSMLRRLATGLPSGEHLPLPKINQNKAQINPQLGSSYCDSAQDLHNDTRII